MDYDLIWSNLNAELRFKETETGGLSAALAGLENHQRKCGFIQDDLQEVKRLVFKDPKNGALNFRAQVNPKRARRKGGAGIKTPPPGEERFNDGCFLCRENIRWQQNQRQIGFEITTSNDIYNAWMNPFPLLPNHVVVAARQHIPQAFKLFADDREGLELNRILSDLCETAQRLPNHIGFYNGVGAGASIPEHLHFQFFQRIPEDPLFPLEQRSFESSDGNGTPEMISNYPISVVRWRGKFKNIVSEADVWVRTWADENVIDRNFLTCNFIATGSPNSDEIVLYFVPRRRDRQFWNGDKGIVGGLEILGELVLASEEECALVENGIVDYGFIEDALSAVCAPLN